jgi:hypothetical protein
MSDAHAAPAVTPQVDREIYQELAGDLARIFGSRLTSLLAYGEPHDEGAHTLALVEQLTFADLAKCAPRTQTWHRLGLATPLILTRDEFRRTLDVFPLEYGDIIARHVVLAGDDPFTAISVPDADLRRGCEQLAKSHLIHLREGFLETGGDAGSIARLIAASAPGFRALIDTLERLEPGAVARAGVSPELVHEVTAAPAGTIAEPSALTARYIAAVEQLWKYVDRWRT